MINDDVRGGEKSFIIAVNSNPKKESGGPGRTGRMLPSMPRIMRIMLIVIPI